MHEEKSTRELTVLSVIAEPNLLYFKDSFISLNKDSKSKETELPVSNNKTTLFLAKFA